MTGGGVKGGGGGPAGGGALDGGDRILFHSWWKLAQRDEAGKQIRRI